MYLWFVCCCRRTAGVWHTGSCKVLFSFANKECFCFFPFLTLVVFPVWPLGGETPQTQELRKSEQNTIFIPYIQYIQCNTTRLSAQGSAHLSTSLSTPESHQSVQTGWIQKERKKSLLSSSSCVATGTKVKQNGVFLYPKVRENTNATASMVSPECQACK